MKRLEAAQRGLTARIPRLILCFCVLQPLLDILAFWKDALGIPALVLTILRFLTFAGLTGMGFLVSRRKRRYIYLAAFALLYLAGHSLAASRMGYLDPFEDLTDQLRVLMLFFTTAAMMSFLDRSERAFWAMESGLILALGIMAAAVGLSILTGTDPHTYLGKQTGVLGWFLWPNSQSAILSMLTPLSIAWCLKRFRGRVLPVAVVASGCFCLLFLLGTRLAFVCIPVLGGGMAVCIWLADRKAKGCALAVLLAAALFTALYPVSPMREALRKSAENSVVLQQRIDDAAQAQGAAPGAERTENLDALAAAYRYNLQGIVDRFGLERTARVYDFTLKRSEIFDDRRKKRVFNELLMEDAGALSRWFGLEVSRMSQQTELYDFYADEWEPGVEYFAAENDLHGVFYSGGWVLLAGTLGWMLWYGVRALLALIRRGKEVFNVFFAAHCGAYCVFFVFAYATNSVLRQTRNIFCVSAVLAGLWYLSRRGEEKPGPGEEDSV
jgi:hypothetical protein